MYKPGREKATRAELRCPDPACNPYLAFSVMLASGLKGIEQNLELAEPVEEDIFHMSLAERKKRKIDTLPDSLENALNLLEKSQLMRETLGDHIFNKLMANKAKEWDEFRIHVSQYEVNKYLPML